MWNEYWNVEVVGFHTYSRRLTTGIPWGVGPFNMPILETQPDSFNAQNCDRPGKEQAKWAERTQQIIVNINSWLPGNLHSQSIGLPSSALQTFITIHRRALEGFRAVSWGGALDGSITLLLWWFEPPIRNVFWSLISPISIFVTWRRPEEKAKTMAYFSPIPSESQGLRSAVDEEMQSLLSRYAAKSNTALFLCVMLI
jgi:hypothetical protein